MAILQDKAETSAGREEVLAAAPADFKAFWPEIRNSLIFRNRRDFRAFMNENHGRIYCLPRRDASLPPFVLVGDWRSRSETRALWVVRAEPRDKEALVRGVSEACLAEGTQRLVTRPLSHGEAEEYASWGFRTQCGVVLLEKALCGVPFPREIEDIRIIHFRHKYLYEVLKTDEAAFEDFWRLDRRTLERISESCLRNVFLIAKHGSRVCGYAIGGANGRLGYLQRLGVHPEFQGRGLGESLAGRLLRSLQVMGAALVSVNTQEDNFSALSLYHKLGFRETGEKRFILQITSRELPGCAR